MGCFQMELATELDIWENYLIDRQYRREAITRISGVSSFENNGALEWNLAYAICMGRLHYRRVPEPFPAADDVEGLGQYYKTYWNTMLGKATVEGFVKTYTKYVKGEKLC